MKTADIATHRSQYWSRTGRAVRPYVIDPVTITEYPLAETPLLPDADPDARGHFLLDPIHPHLLALTAGDLDSFQEFSTRFGLRELAEWAVDRDLPMLLSLISRYESGYRHFASLTLAEMWTTPEVVEAVTDEQTNLREAFRESEGHDAIAATRIVCSHGWAHGAFLTDPRLDESDGVLYEQPRHIWSRAWYELLQGVSDNQVPQTCQYCGEPFIPRRRNAAYCTGTKCQQRAYDKRRAKTPERKQYQRKYKQQKRNNSRSDTQHQGEASGIHRDEDDQGR